MNTRNFILAAAFGFSAILPSVAKQRTVSNNPAVPAQYTDMATAIAACNVGDTLLVASSPVAHLNVTIDKRITLIGDAPYATGAANTAQITNCFLDSTSATTQADGVHLIGLQIQSVSVKHGVNDVIIERCSIGQVVFSSTAQAPARNVIVRNNLIGYINYTNTTATQSPTPGLLVSNNYISGYVAAYGGSFTNNMFSRGTTNIKECLFSNNIFYGGDGPQGAVSCIFANNLTYLSTQATLPYGVNWGAGNKANQSPKYVGTTNAGSISPTANYTLQLTSPARSAGSDGSDIGPSGGYFPLSIQLALQSPTPVVTQLTLSNTQLLSTGTLTVQVKAKKRD